MSTLKGPSQSILDTFFFSFSFLLRCASFSFCHPSCIMLLCSPLLQFFLASAIVSEYLCRSLPPWSSLHTLRFCQLIHSVHGLALPDDCWTPSLLLNLELNVEVPSGRHPVHGVSVWYERTGPVTLSRKEQLCHNSPEWTFSLTECAPIQFPWS